MFKKARKEQAKARVALVGPSGSGKTYSAISIGSGLGKRVAVIDTERGSASKYAGDVADFDVCELETFAPAEYIKALKAAGESGYDVVVIDSLSHAWSGAGGALEMVDKAAARSQSRNSFAAWREVTPHHHALVDAILRYPGHIIATMRAKTEWVIEEDQRGRKAPRKIGLAPVQRDGLEYEFDVVADMDLDHRMIVSKTRCSALDGAVIANPGEDVAAKLRAWLSDGVAPEPKREPKPKQVAPEQPAAPAQLRECRTAEELQAWIAAHAPHAAEQHGGDVVGAKALEHAGKIGVDPADVDRWLGAAIQK